VTNYVCGVAPRRRVHCVLFQKMRKHGDNYGAAQNLTGRSLYLCNAVECIELRALLPNGRSYCICFCVAVLKVSLIHTMLYVGEYINRPPGS